MEDKPITVSIGSLNKKASSEVLFSTALEIQGQYPLKGHVKISGAKNAALVVMAGTTLCSGDCRLRNIPKLSDVKRMSQVLSALGLGVKNDNDVLEVNASEMNCSEAPYELVSQLRASFFIIGPMLARLGEACVPLPGGCAIGARPVDLHVRGLQSMGAHVQIEHGVVKAYVPGVTKRLKGANIYLDYPSVGATETLMMAATLADGETTIENAAQEPEVVDLANFCISMGARISGAGTKKIVIEGVSKLHSTDYSIIPDRIEAATFLIAGAITRSEISLSPVIPEHLTAAIAKLGEIGCKIAIESPNHMRIIPGYEIKASDISTMPYPGFPTDMQAQFMALLTLSNGDSSISETVFENRMRHVAELKRLGANITVKGNTAMVRGVPMLSGAPVLATDLRASAGLILAGLAAEGTTIVQDLQHLDRGYERLDLKLEKLGARLRRISANDTTKMDAVKLQPLQMAAQ